LTLTEPVEAAYVVLIHTDAIPDVRDLAGFVHVSEYGQRKVISEHEVGSWEEFRFVAMPIMTVEIDTGVAGASGLNPPLLGSGSGKVDVYSSIVMAQECFGQVALRGRSAISPTLLPATAKNHANPMGTKGFVGVDTWYVAKALNENWMVRIKHGAAAL
jgi:N4-gp56 family major capsid protein